MNPSYPVVLFYRKEKGKDYGYLYRKRLLRRKQKSSKYHVCPDHHEAKSGSWSGYRFHTGWNVQTADRVVQKRRSGFFSDHIRKP